MTAHHGRRDEVRVGWLNAGAYDQVRVYRDRVVIGTLPGAPAEFTITRRGLYRYEVAGIVGAQESSRSRRLRFAGRSAARRDDSNPAIWRVGSETVGRSRPRRRPRDVLVTDARPASIAAATACRELLSTHRHVRRATACPRTTSTSTNRITRSNLRFRHRRAFADNGPVVDRARAYTKP